MTAKRMMGRRGKLMLGVVLALALFAAARSVVIVDQTESALVVEFGKPVRLIDEPGLHFKRPYQSTRSFDKRLQLDLPPAREMLTKDKKNLEIAWYTTWRIGDVKRFIVAVRGDAQARLRLEEMAASILAAELGAKDLADLVSVGGRGGLEALALATTERMRAQALDDYGVVVTAVRPRRLGYPEEVRGAVFEQVRSERKRVAAATRAEGESQARIITSAADREREIVLAQAESDAARLIGEGEAKAARIMNEAHAADPAFYQFLKTLETYRAALDSRTTLVLSADSPFLRLLSKGLPEPAREPTSPKSGPSAPVAVRGAKTP